MKNLLFTLLCLNTLFFACKKDAADTRSSHLTSTDCWVVTKIEFFDSSTQVWEDFSLDDCLTENCWSFQKDGEFVWDNGIEKCDPTEPQTITGTWDLSQNGETLNISVTGYDSGSLKIIELTKNRLITQDSVSNFGFYTLVRDTYEPK
ncbi:MAG: lipocalin family protein [Phycisphaerae bacterium]|nr:lipocalin family protein [Saprospiraceae bacterium]